MHGVCVYVCTPVYDYLGIAYIKELVYCHYAGFVET